MIRLNAIPLNYEPRNKILPKLRTYENPNTKREPEMSAFDSAFLCGTIKTFRPKKILEVGVAGGATTAIILQTLEDIGESYEMHSIDKSVQYHLDLSTDTAFLAKFALENNLFAPPHSKLRGKHEFHIGKILPQIIDEIGGGIDLVILDTVHRMPGEGLDFITVLPYLKLGSIVVLHDVRENQRVHNKDTSHATTALFSAVTANKFLNFIPDGKRQIVYPNIAAFQINEQTAANIENVFLTMVLRWDYLPSNEDLNFYWTQYQRHYPAELCAIFNETLKMNFHNLSVASSTLP